ncbi:MAG: cellulase family glycosylhydrolase [Solirubrobacterales bacterium]
MACALFVALALPAAAPAARGLTTGFQADEYVSSDPAERSLWIDRTQQAGAGIVRLSVSWLGVAAGNTPPPDPTNPGSASYNFSQFDQAIRDLEARGITVMLNVGPPSPPWAEAPGRPASFPPGRWKPQNPQDFADFMQAVAARYSGNFDPDGPVGPARPLPAVQAVEIWNEPNGEPWMSNEYGGSPDYYREMLNDSYRAVKSVNPQMLVVVGATSPYGDPPNGPYPASGGRVYPVTFWEQVLCVRPVKTKKKGKKGTSSAAVKYVRTPGCSQPVMFDVFAHHPIDNTGAGPLQSGPTKYDASTPDLGRVVQILRGAEKAGTTLSGKHPVWVTEFWWDSNPPNPSGAKLAVQARWIEQSLYLFWKAGASVAINFMIRDTPARPTVHAGFQAGIFLMNGKPKPSFTAFHFPFVTSRTSKTSLQAWGKAPAGGKLLIQRKQHGTWVTIKKLQVSQGAVFVTKLPGLRGAQRLRATVAGNQSLIWKQPAIATRSSDGGHPLRYTLALIGLIALITLVVVGVVLRRREVSRRRRAGGSRRGRDPARMITHTPGL